MWRSRRAKVVEITSAADSTDDVSLFRGGPFYRAQAFIHLVRPSRWNLGRRVIFVLVVTWLTLVILTALFSPGELAGQLKNLT